MARISSFLYAATMTLGASLAVAYETTCETVAGWGEAFAGFIISLLPPLQLSPDDHVALDRAGRELDASTIDRLSVAFRAFLDRALGHQRFRGGRFVDGAGGAMGLAI